MDHISILNALDMAVQLLSQQDERIKALEQKLEAIATSSSQVQQPKYYSVIAYAHLNSLRISGMETRLISAIAIRLCEQSGTPYDILPDARWGKVNAYPLDILELAYNEYFERQENGN